MDQFADVVPKNGDEETDHSRLVSEVKEVFNQFKAVYRKGDDDTAQLLMSRLMVLLKSFPPMSEDSPISFCDRALPRDIYEYAIMMIREDEDPAFFMVFDLLRPYYSEAWESLLPPPYYNKYTFIGRYLKALLQLNKFAEFHNELKSLPDIALTDLSIKRAIKLEKLLSEQATRFQKTPDSLSVNGTQEEEWMWKLHNGSLYQVVLRAARRPDPF